MGDRPQTWFAPSSSQTVLVPEALRETFDEAQENVRKYFTNFVADPATGRIEIGDDRYVLVRASALSIDFLDTVLALYDDREPSEALEIGRALLFDIAHTIGKNEARSFHARMELTDPMARLATGPVHFAYSGWALVQFRDELPPEHNEDFCLVYEHPYSFEADSWIRAGRTSKSPVCIMNAGYSSGWVEESFGIGLTSVELRCKARGDETCEFLMAPPAKIALRLEEHNHDAKAFVSIPSYFGRKREEDELRQRELRLKNILAAMPLPVLIVGDNDELLYANSHANAIFKIASGSSIIAELFVDGASFDQVVNGARGGKRLHSQEHEMKDHAGVVFPALVSSHSLVLPDGVRGVALTALDVTDFKRAQASLRQSERLATVGTLTAGVAHEVNNPLAYTIANLERLSAAIDGDAPLEEVRDTLRRSVDSALDGAHRVRRIVRDLRELSRGEEQESNEVVVLEEVLEKAVLLSEMTWRRRATLIREFKNSSAVSANRSRLVQVFVNMIVNAAHAIEEGAASKNTITVSTEVRSDEWIEAIVRDTGRGMTQEQQARVFDPFFTTKEVGEGTGLGLSISKSIIERLGGRVSIESALGVGTTITVLLRKAVRRPVASPREPIEPADLAGLRILLVDDEPALTEVLSDMLAEADVVVAGSGRTALETLSSVDVDLILCDLMMPEVTGIEFYRRCPAQMRQRIVFMTGGVYTDDARAFLQSIENPCLEKPIELAELRAALSLHAQRLARARPQS